MTLPFLTVDFSTNLVVIGLFLSVPFLSAQAQPSLPTEGRIAYHNYSAYDIDPGNPNGPNSLDGQIRLYDFATNSVSTIGVIDKHVRHAINPNFSSDGSKITFMGIPRGPNYGSDWTDFLDVYEYDFKRGKLTNLSTAAKLNSSIDEDAVFGPDDATVIYKKDRDDFWSIDLATYQSTQLFPSGVEVSGPKVSPNGQGITYWTSDGSTANVYRREFQPNGSVGAAIAVATTPGLQDYFPSFLDDQTIVYSRWSSLGVFDDDIYLANLGTGQSTPSAFNQSGSADDSDAFRLVDTNNIGFSSTRSGGKGGYDLYVGDATTGDVHYLQVASTPKEDLGSSYHAQIVQVQSGLSLFEETFDVAVATSTVFNNLYGGPQFDTDLNNTDLSVGGGVLRLATNTGFGEANVFTTSAFSPDAGIVITADIGANASNGDYNVGIAIGETPIVFHPGFTDIPGAFRIGTGSNQDMGFTPANGVLHSWKIEISDSGDVTITITDGLDANNVFTTSYTDTSLTLDGFSVGLYREGGTGSSPFYGLYDNLFISTASSGLPGDYNEDGMVDAADYSVWLDNLGNSTGLPNDNNLGSVGSSHYDLWKTNFGTSAIGGSVSASIPEPASGITLLLGIAPLLLLRESAAP